MSGGICIRREGYPKNIPDVLVAEYCSYLRLLERARGEPTLGVQLQEACRHSLIVNKTLD